MGALLRTLRTIMYKLGVSGIGFISSALVARVLTVSDRGIYNLVTTGLLLISTFLTGYGNFFNYGINRLQYDRADVVGVLARLYTMVTVGTVIVLAISVSLIKANDLFIYIAFVVGTVPFSLLFVYCTRLVQAQNEIDWLNRLNTIQAVIFLVFAGCVFAAHRFQHSELRPEFLTYILWGWLVSNALASLVAVFVTARLSRVRLYPKKHPEIAQKMFQYGHSISMQNLLSQLNYRGDLFSVSLLAGTAAAGLYGIAVASSEILWQVSSSIALIVYTKVAREERNNSIMLTERTFRFTFWVLVIGALLMFWGFSPLIHIVYTSRYDRSVLPFQVLLIGTMAFGTTGVFTQFFTDQLGKVKYPMYMQGASLATNLILCFVLIPHIGILGGALASSTAYVVALLMSITYFHYHTKRPIARLFILSQDDLHLLKRLTPVRRSVHEGGK